MAKIRFYLLDVTYKILADKPVIHLYGRTVDGQQICVHDENFAPYFFAVPKPGANLGELREQLKALRQEKNGETAFVTGIAEEKKKVNEHETNAIKVFVNLPKSVPAIKDLAKQLPAVTVYEADIKYHRRYLIDKGITPMTLVEVEGELVAEVSKVPVVKATSVMPAATDDTLTTPRVLALDIETYNPLGKTVLPEQHPIIMLSLYGENFEKVLCWKTFATKDKTIEFVKSELELLERFKQLVEEYKPDILVGYYSDGFDLPYIRTRANKYKLKLDLGLDHSELAIHGRGITTAEITGIVHVDIYKFIKKIISRSMDTDVFTLEAVSAELLGDHKHDVDLEKLAHVWDNKPEDLEVYCKYNLHDSRLTFQLTQKILPNMVELVKVIGQSLFDINRMSFSQLVEWFIIKQAFGFNEIVLNRPGFQEEQERRFKRIKGAFVFEPTPGLYKNVVVFDYRSLYPTIIASHNISPGTLNCSCCEGKNEAPVETGRYWYCTKKKGFVSTIIEDLITRRARIKELIKQNPKDQMLLARSEALKVLANSFYGYLGFSPARWYCFACGESTTAWGRAYIKKVIAAANEEKFQVLYSDTDSIFLQLEGRTKEDALKFRDKINMDLPGLMELDYEGFYPAGIFVSLKAGESGAKKKYALIDEKGVVKIRGFETVRRNWSFIAKDVQKEVLNIILKEHDAAKAAAYVKEVIGQMRQNKIPVAKVVIFTQLQKEIAQYESFGPHVAAAQRMQNKGIPVGPGTMLRYVIMRGSGKIRDRVKLDTEAKQEEYDAEYYINNQIVPSVERIFAAVGLKIDDLIATEGQKTLSGFFEK